MNQHTNYSIKVDQFEGPFDLLLFFIERDEMDIYNIQITKIINDFPIVLFGKDYYKPLFDHLQVMVEKGTISAEDLNLVLLTDDIEDATQHILTYVQTNYQVKKRKRLWWLFEKV